MFGLGQGVYSISLQAAQRQNVQSHFQAFEVLVDGKLVDLIAPTSSSYTSYRTLNFTVMGVSGHTIQLKGLNPLSGDNTAFVTNIKIMPAAATADLNEPVVLAQALSDFQTDGSITYNDMLGLFAKVEADAAPQGVGGKGPIGVSRVVSGVTSTDLQCLQTIVADAASLRMPADVSNLAGKVVNGDWNNATYQSLDSQGNVQSTPLGNLKVGSSATQLQDLVNKWFRGDDYPTAAHGGVAAAYIAANGHLFAQTGPMPTAPSSAIATQIAANSQVFAQGAPAATDVIQGQIGDCWLLSSLLGTAKQAPGIITSMFHEVAPGVWTVRFFNNGATTYVTVNNELPYYRDSAGNLCTVGNNPSLTNDNASETNVLTPTGAGNVLWAALAEKAYAESYAKNSYVNLDQPGQSQGPLAHITGRGIWERSFKTIGGVLFESSSGSFSTSAILNGSSYASSPHHLASQIYNAFECGEVVTLTSTGNGPDGRIVGNHLYAVTAAWQSNGNYYFTLGNPWGPAGGYSEGQNFYPGTVENVDSGTIGSNFDYVAFTQK